jgi:hypothetical protein
MQYYLIKPYRITLPSEVQRQFCFHLQRFFPGHFFKINLIVQRRSQIRSILPRIIRGKLVSFLIPVSRLVLFKSFGGSFTCHSDIQTFKNSVVLRIGCAEFPVVGKNIFPEFNYVNAVGHVGVPTLVGLFCSDRGENWWGDGEEGGERTEI